MRIHHLLIVAIAICGFGCMSDTANSYVIKVGDGYRRAPKPSFAGVKAVHNPYRNAYYVTAPEAYPREASELCTFQLSSGFTTATAPESFYLTVDARMLDWRFFETATDNQAVRLKVEDTDRQVLWGSVREVMGIRLTRNYLESRTTTGLNIRLEGDHGNLVVMVPAEYVSEFMSVVDSERERLFNTSTASTK